MSETTCSVEDETGRCPRPIRSWGMCNAHRERMRRNGDPGPVQILVLHGFVEWSRETVLERVEISPTGCWLWRGPFDGRGYGRVKSHGRTVIAHRFVYELLAGAIPDAMPLDHICHSSDLTCPGDTGCAHRRCVNPEHLEPVTAAENNRRMMRNLAARGTFFKPINHGTSAGCKAHLRRGEKPCDACRRAQNERRTRRRRAARLERTEVAS